MYVIGWYNIVQSIDKINFLWYSFTVKTRHKFSFYSNLFKFIIITLFMYYRVQNTHLSLCPDQPVPSLSLMPQPITDSHVGQLLIYFLIKVMMLVKLQVVTSRYYPCRTWICWCKNSCNQTYQGFDLLGVQCLFQLTILLRINN